MTKSRTALAALALLGATWPAAVAGQTAEDTAARQQAQVRDMVARSCPSGGEGNDVVVCGRRDPVQRYRAPLPAMATAGPRDRAGGEQLAQLNAGGGSCSAAVRDQRCNGGLRLFSIGASGLGGIAGLLAEALADGD